LQSHNHAPQLIAKALVALYGSIFFWVGLWTSLDADFFPRSLERDLSYARPSAPSATKCNILGMYTFIGLALMVAADSFYSNAGVDGRSA